MSTTIYYLTHPQVEMNPAIPVPHWGLNALGRTRAASLIGKTWLSGITQIISSAETKAIETAEPLARSLKIDVEIRERMHENDRSATGFLKPDEFEKVADGFFAKPTESMRGWERALDAQSRIVREVESILQKYPTGNLLFVGHGAVGTLLYCHYAQRPISRHYDQPAGGGCLFSLLRGKRQVIHGWKRLEEVA